MSNTLSAARLQATRLHFLASVLVFATFGLFAGAASAAKIYTMVVQSTSTTTVKVTIHNVTPENNSVINSFVINKPSGATSLTPLNPASSLPAVVVQDANGNIKVNGLPNGLKSANRNPNTIDIFLSVNWGSTPVPICGSSVEWTSTAYTGNFSATTFQLVDAANNNTPITSVSQSFNCFSLTGLPAALVGGTTNQTYNAQLTNLNAAGGPSITSLSVSGSSGVTTTVTFASPVAPGGQVPVTVKVTTSCAAAAGSWTAVATGTGGQGFSGNTTASSYSVTPCSFVFAPGPPNPTTSGDVVNVKLTATNGSGGGMPWNGVVTSWELVPQTPGDAGTATAGAGTCVDAPTCSTWSFDVTITITKYIGHSFQLKATASVGTALSNLFSTEGVLNCFPAPPFKSGELDPGAPIAYVYEIDEGKYGLVRGLNKDGGPCAVVPYTFDVDINSTPQKAKFIVPPGTGQGVAVEYVIVWKAVPANSSGTTTGWTDARPNLAWKTCDQTIDPGCAPGTPVYIPGLACIEDPVVFDEEFGTLGPGDLAALLPTIPNVAPFNAAPFNAYYPVGSTAKMCVAQQGWTAAGSNHVRYWTKIIDQGDGFVVRAP